ncbi:hypothetical protein ACIA8H_35920 [Streptomyces goshikiensis]|uniref:hypothetical protein n=1 Tax=Streptomyces goshikiensis TaxID=1942 RepID=UPI0037B47FB2
MTDDTPVHGPMDSELVVDMRELLTEVRDEWRLADWTEVSGFLVTLEHAAHAGHGERTEALVNALRTKGPGMPGRAVNPTGPAPADSVERIDRILDNTPEPPPPAHSTSPDGDSVE